jgi:hypothetical protein
MAKHLSMLWGGTGTGKTDLLGTFAKGLFEGEGKKTRLVSAEKAQSEGILREGIEAGYILPWWLNDRMDATGNVETPFERLTDAMLGKWPADTNNPYSSLISAFSIQYKATCREAAKHPQKDEKLIYQGEKPPTSASQLQCPMCKTAVILETVRVVTDERLKEVGAYFCEGATEYGDMMMQNLQRRAALGESTGGNVATRFQDGQMWVGSNTQGHYGTAQNQIKNKVGESVHLPVDYVWWTAVMEDGKDEDRGGVLVFGPKIPGVKKTADVPRWFGSTLSTCTVPVMKNGAQEAEYRLYLKEYFQDWIPLIAKQRCIVDNRIPAGRLKDIPQFIAVDHTKAEVEVAGTKLKLSTLLYDVTKLIESRQNPKKVEVAK